MVRGQSNHDIIGAPKPEERVQELSEESVEPKNLVVDLARIRTIAVSDCVGRGERYRQHIGLRSGPQPERVDSVQREGESDLIHPRELGQQTRGRGGIGRGKVRESEAHALTLYGNTIRFRVFAFR
jgi:hypothetical protein